MKKDNILKKGLTILFEASKMFDEGLDFISYSRLKRQAFYIDGDPRRLANNFRSLERTGYIKIDKKNDSVKLTNKGRIKIVENTIDNTRDGKWRFLSWDIPENLSAKRQKFCRSIRRFGYKQVQKSLWVSPYKKSDEIYLIIKELDIGKYVSCILAEKTDIESHLKKLFPSG